MNSWNAQYEVELFRLVNGNLPTEGNELTKRMAKYFLDKYTLKDAVYPNSMFKREHMIAFAFNVYASSNTAYNQGEKI